jgi:hypothetical protein
MGKDKELCYFSVNDENALALKYFDIKDWREWVRWEIYTCIFMQK